MEKKTYCRQYYQDNKDRIKARCKQYYQDNKDAIKIREQARRDKHRVQRNEVHRKWAAANRSEAYRRTFKSYLKRKYKITIEQYEEMMQRQNGLCAICNLLPLGRGSNNGLVLDHCRYCGKLRKFLCGHCNKLLGLVSDDPEILRSAIKYLEGHDHANSK